MRYDLTWRDIKEQREWSDRTFGPGTRLRGVLNHIRKELAEVEESCGKDITEWVDIMVLAVDGATRSGHKPEDLLNAYAEKMAENYQREWPDWRDFSEDEPIEHVREDRPLTFADFGVSNADGMASVAGLLAEGYVEEYRRMAGGAVLAPEEDPR